MKNINFFIKLGIFSFICLVVSIVGIYVYAYFSPPIKLNSANAIFIFDNKEQVVYQGNHEQEWVKLEDISEFVKIAIVSVEDKHFYRHHGFDYLRILKSFYLNIRNREIVGGASTISQQYVKNMYLDFGQTWQRKAEEALLTINLETHYTKDEILEGYLNTINFGQGNFGIESASQFYFNKRSNMLNLEESILLVGIPRSPENYNPINNYDLAIERAWVVADSMLKNGYITEKEYNSLFQKEIEIYGRRKTNNLRTLMYYYEAVIHELNNIHSIPKSLIKSGGLKVYTSLDIDIQTKMDESIAKHITSDGVQFASIVTDPRTGGVLALAGGVDYAKSQFNRVTQSKRHVGSTIKPFLYYAALKNNMTSASTFLSEETSFVFANNEIYSPTNFGNRYGNKNITMSAALAFSDNIYAVKTHLFIGPEVLVETMKQAGLREELSPNPSLALGAYEINMFDYAKAYGTLANNGVSNDLFFITRVEDGNGRVLYEHKLDPEHVLESDYVYIVNEMMTASYNPSYLNYTAPTLLYLNPRFSHRYALKSGTTDNDYWLVGYTPEILMIVWGGNDMNEDVHSSYSRKIKEVWTDTVEFAFREEEPTWYEMPQNIVALPLNAISGEYDLEGKNSALFYFRKGTEPLFYEE